MVRIAWVVLAMLATVVVACGGSAATATPVPPGVAIQRYIDAITPIIHESNEAFIDAHVNNQIGRRTPAAEAVIGLNLQVEFRAVLVEKLGSVDAPPEMRAEHDEIVALTDEWITVGGRAISIFAAADPEAPVENVIDIFDLEVGPYRTNAIDEKSKQACENIEKIAANHGVTAELGCATGFDPVPFLGN